MPLAFNACNAYNTYMVSRVPSTTTLTIRNVNTTLKERLRMRAARNGRSMESELRHILSDALTGEKNRGINLAESIRRRFAPFGGVGDLEPQPPTPIRTPPSFD